MVTLRKERCRDHGPVLRRLDRCSQAESNRDAVTTDRNTATKMHLEFAHVLADISARAILPYFRKPLTIANKAGPSAFDPVTAADRAAERAIRKAVQARFPDHGIVGEGYGYCLLAAGFIDLIVEADLKPFDVVALVPIIEAAGGVVTTWDGAPATDGGRIIAAGDSRVHREAMAILRGGR